MILLCGRDEIMGNINRLARYENPKGLLNTTPKLKESYLDFLDRRQEGIKTNRSDDVFVADAVMQDQFSRAFQQGVLNDLSKDNVFGKKYEIGRASCRERV